jgi:Mn-dependent DtxR family transcriptional regulator
MKPDPTMGKSLYLATYKKIVEYLKEQSDFIFKSELYYELGVSNDSINIAIAELDSEGKLEFNEKKQIKYKW